MGAAQLPMAAYSPYLQTAGLMSPLIDATGGVAQAPPTPTQQQQLAAKRNEVSSWTLFLTLAPIFFSSFAGQLKYFSFLMILCQKKNLSLKMVTLIIQTWGSHMKLFFIKKEK